MFDGAILRNKYNIHLYDKKNPFKYPLSYQKNCLGTQKLVWINWSKQAIGVYVIELLL